MAVLVIAITPGLDAATYDKVTEATGSADALPEGCRAHHAGPIEGGWRVVAVWDSAERAAEYARTTLGPALAANGLQGHRPEVSPLHATLP